MGLKQQLLFQKEAFILENGATLQPVEIGYETYGQLNADKSNAILLLHALTGTAHAAKHHEADTPGWWDDYIGPGKALDTDRFFVICPNVFGGCSGSTGPSSINPKTGIPYRLSFPGFSVKDIVRVQYELIKTLHISKLKAVIGGSMGGMQATEWAICYSDHVNSVINIASPLAASPDAIGFNLIQRMAILNDPDFNDGNYIAQPEGGLATARMVGMMTYRTSELFSKRFERFTVAESSKSAFSKEHFQIESYLQYQGDSFVERFDANSYLYLTKAIDLFDVIRSQESEAPPYSHIKIPYLLIGITSDQLFRISDLRRDFELLKAAGVPVTYHEIDSEYGHDAFLVHSEVIKFAPILTEFLLPTEKIAH
ncbi:homoserine O-acetyltransferase [Listeria fleischmannii 1991]|uniref:Homoserine O-acetyltransferase n=2 Tax=Listeria fleischmannii TaxID=1069827 RepID=A0A2X3H777_9LIST|nr:homoserine O-acetyltransferase [Listeria fleischmannii]KMT59749.1 homoserine O-acetyltransferase [Listeria fleischmannii 1991]SQC67084.1 Homoserine O-acetyltransferase [Listeria fleischmannii subsp. fleischmannii]